MILLHCALLSLFLLLGLSEGRRVIHADCTPYWHMVEEDFVKTQQKVHTLWEELTALSSVNTGVTSPQGNAGLFRSAGYLFDPISDFYTVIQALLVVGGNLYNDYTTGGYAPYMNNNDIMIRCSMDGLTELSKGNWVDQTSIGNSITQDAGNVEGCFKTATLKSYVTVPPDTANRPSIIRLCPGFIQSEVAKYQQPATNPERLCYQLWGVNPQQLLFNSEAKTVVDFAVLMDPYTEYFRAVLQTAGSGINNGGRSRSRLSNLMNVFNSPTSDGWQTWINNRNKSPPLIVPAAVAALSTLLEQQRYCFQRPILDGTFQPSPRNQQNWIQWVSVPQKDFFINGVGPAGA